MSFPVNFKFPYQTTGIQFDFSKLSSPVQTVTSTSDWVVGDEVESLSLNKHSAAIKYDGTLWLWGLGANGRLGNNNVNKILSPVQTVSTGNTWFQVSAGGQHTAAIKNDGTLWIWGCGDKGNLGDGREGGGNEFSSPIQTISATTCWKQVSLGCLHSAAIKTDGTLWLWGYGLCGSLGNDSTTNRCSPVQTVSATTCWKQVSLGDIFSAAIKTDGTLWLWGQNDVEDADGNIPIGSLGNNRDASQSSPVQTVSTGTNWKQVSLGAIHAGAVKTDGTLWIWGCGQSGRLGTNDKATNYSSPVQTLTTGTNWKQIELGSTHSSAVKTDGTLWMWGCGQQGRLGNNDAKNDRSSPVQTISAVTTWRQSSAGFDHSAATKIDGTLWLWGRASNGVLGNNAEVDLCSPVQTVSTANNWVATVAPFYTIGAGSSHSAAIETDGTLWLWGCNISGQLGNNSTINQSSPVQTVSATTCWKQVSLGNSHSAAIKTDGTLWLWGNSSNGQLGNNSTTPNQSSPIQTTSATTNWKQVSLIGLRSGAIKTDGTLWTWGDNCFGALGDNSTIQRNQPVQTTCLGTNWNQLSLGGVHSSAIKTDGTLWLWGRNDLGQLGNNSTINRSTPIAITGINWKSVALGDSHSAAIKTDGTLWLWGKNFTGGELGDNSTINQSNPVQTVSTGTNWKQVSLGLNFSAAVKTDGTLWLWGCASNCGRLGDNSTISKSSPIQTVATNIVWSEVSLGSAHVLALTENQRLYNWGENNVGQLGLPLCRNDLAVTCADFDDVFVRREIFSQGGAWGWGCADSGRLGNNNTVNQSSPVQTISGGVNWKQASLGNAHSAAIKTDGTLWLWGVGTSGQLGDNSTISKSSPVQTIGAATNWKQVSLGATYSAAIKSDGTLWIWGAGTNGRLGNNSTISQSSPVQTVSTVTNWKQVSLGNGTTATIKTDGTLWLWGCNSQGSLGNNSTINESSPVQTVSATTCWKQVSLGGYGTGTNHSAAIKTDGTLWLWGYNDAGQLGTDTTTTRSLPVQTISATANWKQVSLGSQFSAAVKTDGTLWLWGCGAGGGLLGNNSTVNVSSPVQTVSTGNNWKQVSLGGLHSAAIKTDGTLWLWGCNQCGRLGNNSTINESSPVQTITTGTNWIDISVGGFTGGATVFGIREDCY